MGQAIYDRRDLDVERAVVFLVERMGIEHWQRRRSALATRFGARLKPDPRTTPDEGVSVRDIDDEIAWYLYLAEISIADPPALETDQGNRVMPYFSAIGRKLDAIRAINGVEERLDRMLRAVKKQDPDQAIFELLVGSTYVEEGWGVTMLPENSSVKSPDFLVKKGLRKLEVECKRLTRRAEYTTLERDAWLRQWKPTSQWIQERGLQLIFTVEFFVEIAPLPAGHILKLINKNLSSILSGTGYSDETCSISATRADIARIKAHLDKNYVKCSSSFERSLLTGRYEPDYGLTYAVGGHTGTMGAKDVPGNVYWMSIDYVSGAYWRCRAPAALDAKARDIRKRLSEATAQLSGQHEGVAHLGIETSEGDDVEGIRSEKIISTIANFDPRGKPLEWIYLHFLRGEGPPDGSWAIDETCHWRGRSPEVYKPMRSAFIVSPEGTVGRPGVHWDSNNPFED